MNEAAMYDCALFIVANFFWCLLLQCLFSTLVGVLTSATFGGTTNYVLIGFTVLLPLTIYSNNGAFY